MHFKKLIRSTLVVSAVLSLTACGHIQKEMSSEEMMLDKAEFATGITAKNLKIVPDSVRAEIDSVHYKVKARNGNTFRCYFTSAIAVTSDAICTPIDGSGKAFKNQKKKAAKEGRCNELLRAAGRC